ncbi:LeuD/DmdB family oxidoreductase small subunit [Streptomyces sp. NPDC001135]
MTLVRQLFQHALGRPVRTGEVVDLPFDLCWGSEMTVKWALDILRDSGFDDTWIAEGIARQREKTAFVFDHVVPTHTASMASILVELRRFAKEHGIRVFDVGYDGGIQHKILIEQGLIRPGDVAVGADSHSCTAGAVASLATGIGSTDLAMALVRGTCWMRVPEATLVRFRGSLRPNVQGKDVALHLCGLLGVHGAVYRSLEFGGPGLASLAVNDRLSLSNMAVEMGAKYGLFPTDEVLDAYLADTLGDTAYPAFTVDDDDPDYVEVIDVDLSRIEPTVALPFSPDNAIGTHQLQHVLSHWGEYAGREDLMTGVAPLAARADDQGRIPVDQVFIGSCTNGHLEDLRVVADTLRGKRVQDGVRTIVIPASQKAYRAAMKEGLIDVLLEAGCYVESSSCGPCIGIKSGVLGTGEVAVFTSNRNFRGRCGDVDAAVVLASPAVAAQAALTGFLAPVGERAAYYADEAGLRRSVEDLFALHAVREGRAPGAAAAEADAPQAAGTAGDEAGDGSLAWVFGDHVNTDVILPSVYCQIPDPAEYRKHIMAHAGNEAFLDHYRATGYDLGGSAIVGGMNFGCGSSRENAPMGIKAAGTPFVVAHSFARIFARNSLNIGLRLIEVGDFAYSIREGDRLVVDDERGELLNLTRGTSAPVQPPSAFERQLLTAGGLVAFARTQRAAGASV